MQTNKHEIRKPNSRKPKEARIPRVELNDIRALKKVFCGDPLEHRLSGFGLRISFGSRISNFGFRGKHGFLPLNYGHTTGRWSPQIKHRCPSVFIRGLNLSQKLVEPEVVATSPCPVKSRVPVCCGFDSWKWCSRRDSHLHWRRSQRRASAGWATRANFGMDIPGRSLPPAQCLHAAEDRLIYFALGGVRLKWHPCRATLFDDPNVNSA